MLKSFFKIADHCLFYCSANRIASGKKLSWEVLFSHSDASLSIFGWPAHCFCCGTINCKFSNLESGKQKPD